MTVEQRDRLALLFSAAWTSAYDRDDDARATHLAFIEALYQIEVSA